MKPAPAKSSKSIRAAFFADKLGICLSGLCLVHCLLTPFVLIALPSLTVASFESHHIFHELLLIVLPIVALAAFVPGYLRHRDLRVFFWSIPGLALLAIAATIFHDDIWLQAGVTITGSLLLIKAHMLNRHLCACCESHPKKDETAVIETAQPVDVQQVSST
ncbi:MAG: MerC domain-containing protein [Bdellovibrionota bacterium]